MVVSDQVGAGVDLVVPDENGHIFPFGNVAALADRISKLIDLSDEDRRKTREKSYNLMTKWNDRDLPAMLSEYLDSIYQAQT